MQFPIADESLKRYLEDIRKTEGLDPEVEARLFELYRQGSLAARNRLIRAHMRFVVKVAVHFRNVPIPLTDLISEGSLGLIRAIEGYDGSRGIKFLTYAVWWIRSYIVKAIQTKGYLVRLPANQLHRISRGNRILSQGGEVSEEIRAMMEGQKTARGGEEEWTKLGWRGSSSEPSANPELGHMERLMEAGLDSILRTLPSNEAHVLRNLFGINQQEVSTLQEVAWDLNVSVERVRQIRNRALERLKGQRETVEMRDCLSYFAQA